MKIQGRKKKKNGEQTAETEQTKINEFKPQEGVITDDGIQYYTRVSFSSCHDLKKNKDGVSNPNEKHEFVLG